MSNELIGLIGIIVLFIFLACRLWIGSAMALVGFLGILIMRNGTQALTVLGSQPFGTQNNYTMTVVPMFVMMGLVVSKTNIGSGMFRCMNAWIGRFRGGLASATVLASGLLGAITGSHMAGTIIMSKIALPEMQRYKYDESLACGAIAGGAPLAIIIPPSIPMIMYGIITEENIGELFIAGIIPGIILMAVYVLIISQWVCRRDPSKAPAGARTTWREKFQSIWGLLPMIILFILVLGGIYAGFFTTTEAGAVGAFGAIVIGFATRQLNFKKLWECVLDSVLLTGTIAIMLIGTNIFIYFISLSKIPFFLSNLVTSMNVPAVVVIIIIAILYIILGMFMPDNPMVVLTIPILYPIISSLGIDGIWFGIFVVFMMALGSISPPVGMVVYLLGGLSKIPINTIFKGVLPFIVGMLIVVILLIIFPSIATFLPNLMA